MLALSFALLILALAVSPLGAAIGREFGDFPAMDLPHNPVGHCNACDHLTFIASRPGRGWTIWGVY